MSGKHAEQRRLTRTVWSNDADNASGWQRKRQVFNEHFLTEALSEITDFDHSVAKASARRNHDFEFAWTAVGDFGLCMEFFIR